MKVLVIGSGGREHTIVWKLAQSSKVDEIFCLPGNAGISQLAKCVDIKVMDFASIIKFAKDEKIDFTVVGMDDPLVGGIVDEFEKEGLKVFGPRKNAAIIEGSKDFSKGFMKKYSIPTADYESFDEFEKALAYVEKGNFPVVIKADGLALGKGVLICNTFEEAKSGLEEIMVEKKFGESGSRVVIEEFLTGPEVSVLSFCDGNTVVPMVSAQDHKRAYDNDEGLNTGGMGTFSPSRCYTEDIAKECMEKIFRPTVDGLNKEGRQFKGIIYFGLMLTKDGPKVIEYNCRFGDPETQVILPRLKTDLFDIFNACVDGTLDKIDVQWDDNAVVCVIEASGGYPEKYEKGYEITGLEECSKLENTYIFHAGTALKDGKFVTNGGRVLGIVGMGKNIEEARETAYNGVKVVDFKDKHFRRDIGIK